MPLNYINIVGKLVKRWREGKFLLFVCLFFLWYFFICLFWVAFLFFGDPFRGYTLSKEIKIIPSPEEKCKITAKNIKKKNFYSNDDDRYGSEGGRDPVDKRLAPLIL